MKSQFANLQLAAQAEKLEKFADVWRHMRHHQQASGNAPLVMNNAAILFVVNLNQWNSSIW